MKVTILGTGAAYPGPGETCSGFLIQQDNTNLLIDCGNGVLSNLQKFIGLPEVTDIYISHMHADHFFDLVPFRYALYYGYDKKLAYKPRLHLPPEGIRVLGQVVSYFAETDTFFGDAFDLSEYQAGQAIKLPDFDLIPTEVKHYIKSYGASILGDRKVAYSSDSGVCEGLYSLAKEADFFICNIGNSPDSGRANGWGHLNPGAAGTLAEEVGAKRMVISHIRPGSEKEKYIERVAANYHGILELARMGKSYEIK